MLYLSSLYVCGIRPRNRTLANFSPTCKGWLSQRGASVGFVPRFDWA